MKRGVSFLLPKAPPLQLQHGWNHAWFGVMNTNSILRFASVPGVLSVLWCVRMVNGNYFFFRFLEKKREKNERKRVEELLPIQTEHEKNRDDAGHLVEWHPNQNYVAIALHYRISCDCMHWAYQSSGIQLNSVLLHTSVLQQSHSFSLFFFLSLSLSLSLSFFLRAVLFSLAEQEPIEEANKQTNKKNQLHLFHSISFNEKFVRLSILVHWLKLNHVSSSFIRCVINVSATFEYDLQIKYLYTEHHTISFQFNRNSKNAFTEEENFSQQVGFFFSSRSSSVEFSLYIYNFVWTRWCFFLAGTRSVCVCVCRYERTLCKLRACIRCC